MTPMRTITARRTILTVTPLWILSTLLVVTWVPEPASIWETLVRAVLCAPLVLYLPGSMVMGTLRFKGGSAAKETLSIFLSLAACIFLSMVLNLTGNLNAQGWVFALGLLTILAWGLNILRPATRPVSAKQWARPGRRFVIFSASALLAIEAVLLARPAALERMPFHFTELWMVPKQAWTNNIVTIGVSNSEETASIYSIDLVLDGALIAKMPNFELAPSISQTFDFSVPKKTDAPARLEAWLYKDGNRENIYRKVWVTINDVSSPRMTFGTPARETKNG